MFVKRILVDSFFCEDEGGNRYEISVYQRMHEHSYLSDSPQVSGGVRTLECAGQPVKPIDEKTFKILNLHGPDDITVTKRD